MSTDTITLRATLPPPPSSNHMYRAGRRRVYKVDSAHAWQAHALLLLRAAGWRSQPRGDYWLSLTVTIFTRRLDADNSLKAIVDVVAFALEIDDAAVGQLQVLKVPVERADEESIDVSVSITRLPEKAGFGECTQKYMTS